MCPASNILSLKVCTKCGEEKPPAEFSKDRTKRDGLRSQCKSCRTMQDAAYRKKCPEQRAVYQASYCAENHERIAAYNATWRAANPAYQSAYYTKNRERILARTAAYKAKYPEKLAARWRNRKARKRAAEGSHTAADIQAQYDRQKGKCYWCSVKVGDEYHVDHVIPLIKGGSNGPENLVVACPTCNMRKHTRLPHEFSDKLC